ncbi:MAG: PQQ-dependent sugar dehydrogenase, partial [Dehalococcoidia bacterium]|nr:PQQ-dependent sugar dehydrogenase [Dehalococcoidia bacterium]
MRKKSFHSPDLLQHVMAIAIVLCVSSSVSAQPIHGEVPQTVADVFLPEVEGVSVEIWVQQLQIPWSLVFLPNGDALVSERPGRIQRIPSGLSQPQLYIKMDEVAHEGDGGLMGLAIHPLFTEHPFVYAMHSYRRENQLFTRVIRLRHQADTGIFDRVVLDNIPGASVHIGGRIGFGPDGMLYIGTGDLWEQPIAQDLNSLAGKILRITPDGRIPADNPFPESPIFSSGHRVVQGLAWNPETGALFSSEHGPSGEWPGVTAR